MEELLKEILDEIKRKDSEDKLTYSLKECSYVSGIGLNTLQEEVAKDNSNFPFFKIGKKIMVDRKLFHQWLQNISKNHEELRRG
ncbi:excisionase [Clostridium botulinum]|uniref:excisionase n=1 Tax=Clostridium botulinum TaxID=1491 RepID=UPI0019680CAB|nr:excisionase [Clostridium botulinum]MBN1072095.1 excisionase [Clostridium botulinum]